MTPLFSELITVKIAHDLAGGIGALSSTSDLMELDPSFISEAPKMLKQNTEMLLARLKFYRALFGLETKTIDSSLVFNYLKTFSTPIHFSGKITSRLELALVALGIQIVIAGGEILYSNNTLIIKDNNLNIKENIYNILIKKSKSKKELETIEAEWLMMLLEKSQSELVIKKNPAFIRFEIKPQP